MNPEKSVEFRNVAQVSASSVAVKKLFSNRRVAMNFLFISYKSIACMLFLRTTSFFRLKRWILLLPLTGILMSCASAPIFDATQVDLSLTPQQVIAQPDESRDKLALWGGTILQISNLKQSTQIEILAYPLNSSQRPVLDSKPLGRFVVQHQGFLEPASYAQGRLLTVLGVVSKTQNGYVGESNYVYPVIRSKQLHLWGSGDGKSRTQFQFGLGFRL